MKEQLTYHTPALLQQCIDGLNISPTGVYVDVTYGGGGHTRAILNALNEKGRVIAFDQDPDAAAIAVDDERLTFIPVNFRYLQRCLSAEGIEQVDGLLADLGVSSHQLDTPARGFSFRYEADLDMRMQPGLGKTAADLLNQSTAAELQSILGNYGEVRNARTLAAALVEARNLKPFSVIQELLAVVQPLIRGERHRYLAQVFQALRIAVNEELEALAELLQQTTAVIRPGGRLVIISYHSLEDRMVKQFIKTGNPNGQLDEDLFGIKAGSWEAITKKPIEPTPAEIAQNSRARSAKLRVAEKRTLALNP